MKRLFLSCLFTCSALFIFAQNDVKDSIGVRALIQQYEDAWNKNDMEAISNLFAEDGSWINIGGLYWKNKAEIRTAHIAFAPYLKFMVPAKLNVQNIQFIDDGIALVFVREAIHMNHDLAFPDGRKISKGMSFSTKYRWYSLRTPATGKSKPVTILL
jgi:uncharacterized protein (TIGR02246 family)